MLIALESYQASWADAYLAIEGELRGCFQDAAVRIDHIGSTAVPGLSAKPVIDVQVTVADLERVGQVVVSMKTAGFEYRPQNATDRPPPWEKPDPVHWQKAYFKGLYDSLLAQIHVRQAGRRNQRYALLFRDYLRANDPVRDAYGRFKVQLADSVGHLSQPSGTGPYLDLKDPFFDLVIYGAEQWALQTNWQGCECISD